MNEARRLFSRSKRRRKTLIVITDGQPGDDVTLPNEQLKKAKVEIFAVGIGRGISEINLRKIATDGRHVYMASFTNLNKIVNSLKTKVCKGNELIRLIRGKSSKQVNLAKMFQRVPDGRTF
jgi:uncharacterized protein YegL